MDGSGEGEEEEESEPAFTRCRNSKIWKLKKLPTRSKKHLKNKIVTSTEVVYRAPANFSASDLRPSITGTASRSVYTLA